MRSRKVTYVPMPTPMDKDEILQDTQDALEELESQIQDLVDNTDLTPLVKQTVDLTRHIEKCDGQLLYLRLNMGRFKHAVADAAAPLGAVLLPAMNRAVRDMTALAEQIGLVMGALVDSLTGYDSAAQGAEAAAKAQDGYTRSVNATRRSLADFDQIQRLNAPTGGGGGAGSTAGEQATQLTPQLQAVVDKILELLEPIRNLDFTPLKTALADLRQHWSVVWQEIGGVLEWIWFELLAPLVAWVVEDLAPVLGETLSGALEILSATLEPVFEGLQRLWEELKPIVEYLGQTVTAALETLGSHFGELAQGIRERGDDISGVIEGLGTVIGCLWETAAPVLELLENGFADTFYMLTELAGTAATLLLESLDSVLEFLTGIFTGNWEQAWNGISGFVKGVINGIIGLLNGLLAGLTAALNGVIQTVNKIQFTLPEWIPGVGGNHFGLHLQTVSTPRIPYLAQGAVLPANRPFLAVVGDQRHGTNVEAPLATIQQAVVQATAAQNSAMLSALQASVGVQQEILSAVLGIHIGDDMIAQAVDRYNRKMAVVYGTGRL